MLTPGTTMLQNRYRIQHKIGGGGMGEVYLAEDTRLPGRQCAIKRMSPAQLAPRDRNWIINAFQQEAQMLANLRHEGLTSVTDFFAERGDWYLVMDYVKGETLEKRLERARKGRLPLDEVLNITRQLCDVLEYLHEQNPTVVFRDLKPANVMLTPEGKVKLIDFGIARFFKPGQTKDTMNLGTPGYAAPELYGGLGQSAPPTDIYGLGVLMHQMVTGHDPTTNPTPFFLPPPGDLLSGLPQNVEEVILRATRVQPDLRFQSVRELRQALFPPTWVLPPETSPSSDTHRGRGKGLWIWLTAGAVVLIGLCVLGLGGALALPSLLRTPPPSVMVTISPTRTSPTTSVTSPSPTSPRSTSTPYVVEPSVDTSLRWNPIGKSVQGRDLEAAIIGQPSESAVVVVGSIQGDQLNTRDLIGYLIDDFNRNQSSLPSDVAFHFIPTINPDGNATGTRRNAHNVDLNRNWDTYDWTANPDQPEGTVNGAGGSRPLSEPETQTLASYLLALQRDDPNLRVVILHSSQRFSSGGHIYPGSASNGLDEDAMVLAQRYAGETGYTIEENWAPYQTTGELLTWCAEEGIEAIDIVFPASTPGSNASLRSETMDGLLQIARFP